MSESELLNEIDQTCDLMWRWIASGKIRIMNGQFPNHHVKRWAELLGYANSQEMVRNPKPEHVELVRSIRGPHGYTIYKMLEAKLATK